MKINAECFVSKSLDLPANIFARSYSSYLFSDIDVFGSEDFSEAIKILLEKLCETEYNVSVFSASSLVFYGFLNRKMQWQAEFACIKKAMNESGDYGGVILIEPDHNFIFYQKNVVEIGVLAFDLKNGAASVICKIKDFFFNCHEIECWLKEKSENDRLLVRQFGRSYLLKLLDSFCGA